MADKSDLIEVLRVLQKYNLKETELLLKKEAKLNPADSDNIANDLEEYKISCEDDPSKFIDEYEELVHLVESVLDIHKSELWSILYPVFVQLYLRLVMAGQRDDAIRFMSKFGIIQDSFYQDDIRVLATVTKAEDLTGRTSQLGQFRSSNFVLSISRESYAQLKRFLNDRSHQVIYSIVSEQLELDIFDGPPRSKLLVDSRRGAMFGEAAKDVNKTRVLYGLLKEESTDPVARDGEGGDDWGEAGDGDKKKRSKPGISGGKTSGGKSSAKLDSNAPSLDRIPLPELKDGDKEERRLKAREMSKRVGLGGLAGVLPSVCMYTVRNAASESNVAVSAMEFTEDSSLLAAGSASGAVQLWSLQPESLRPMRPSHELDQLDKDDPKIAWRMMQEEIHDNQWQCRTLTGHSGPVHDLSFSPDKNLLLSSSSDGSVRLWCCLTWSNVAAYKDHILPVWSTKFSSSHGHYFITGGQDRTARLWATDHNQPLRIFAQHHSDVNVVDFHPNSNYIATGSSDRSVRLFDCLSGKLVRLFTGHKGSVQSLTISPCGRYLASGCWAGIICLWDLSTGQQVGQLTCKGPVVSISFCRDGAVLASGGLDSCLKLWDARALIGQHMAQRASVSSAYHSTVLPDESNSYLLHSFYTKRTPILAVHFTRRNLILTAGPFNQIAS